MWRMTWHAISARPYLVRIAARVVTQKPGRDGSVKGLLAGGGGSNGGRRANASVNANNSRQHIGSRCFIKRGGKHGERINRGADIRRRSLQSGNQREFATHVVVSSRPLLVGSWLILIAALLDAI